MSDNGERPNYIYEELKNINGLEYKEDLPIEEKSIESINDKIKKIYGYER